MRNVNKFMCTDCHFVLRRCYNYFVQSFYVFRRWLTNLNIHRLHVEGAQTGRADINVCFTKHAFYRVDVFSYQMLYRVCLLWADETVSMFVRLADTSCTNEVLQLMISLYMLMHVEAHGCCSCSFSKCIKKKC